MNQSEKTWTTAEGHVIPLSKITHQHWSNIYWYHSIFKGMSGMNPLQMHLKAEFAKTEIDKRFEGKILEWRPEFSYEIKWLNELGLLTGGTKIEVNGRKIGNIMTVPMRHVQGFLTT